MVETRNTMRVLLVEDNRGDAALVMDMLGQVQGDLFQVTHVERLDEANDRLRETAYDVVLLDLRLPDSHGAATVRDVDSPGPGIPIVVLTGEDVGRVGGACLDAGAQGVLGKDSLDTDGLRRALRGAIDAAAGQAVGGQGDRAAYQLRLFVAGSGPEAQRAIANFRALCEGALGDCCRTDVVDVLQDPKLAAREGILATPALVKRRVGDCRQFLGDLGDPDRVLAALGVEAEDPARWS